MSHTSADPGLPHLLTVFLLSTMEQMYLTVLALGHRLLISFPTHLLTKALVAQLTELLFRKLKASYLKGRLETPFPVPSAATVPGGRSPWHTQCLIKGQGVPSLPSTKPQAFLTKT